MTQALLLAVRLLGLGLLARSDALAHRQPGRLHRRTHDDLATLGTWHRAADQQQVARGIDLDDTQFLDGATHDTHVAGHALALEHAARRLALTDRTRCAVRDRVTMR